MPLSPFSSPRSKRGVPIHAGRRPGGAQQQAPALLHPAGEGSGCACPHQDLPLVVLGVQPTSSSPSDVFGVMVGTQVSPSPHGVLCSLPGLQEQHLPGPLSQPRPGREADGAQGGQLGRQGALGVGWLGLIHPPHSLEAARPHRGCGAGGAGWPWWFPWTLWVGNQGNMWYGICQGPKGNGPWATRVSPGGPQCPGWAPWVVAAGEEVLLGHLLGCSPAWASWQNDPWGPWPQMDVLPPPLHHHHHAAPGDTQ